jgi:hypothetical protein
MSGSFTHPHSRKPSQIPLIWQFINKKPASITTEKSHFVIFQKDCIDLLSIYLGIFADLVLIMVILFLRCLNQLLVEPLVVG